MALKDILERTRAIGNSIRQFGQREIPFTSGIAPAIRSFNQSVGAQNLRSPLQSFGRVSSQVAPQLPNLARRDIQNAVNLLPQKAQPMFRGVGDFAAGVIGNSASNTARALGNYSSGLNQALSYQSSPTQRLGGATKSALGVVQGIYNNAPIVTASTIPSGLINSGFRAATAPSGQRLFNAGQGFNEGMNMAKVTKYTDPIISNAVSQASVPNLLTRQLLQRGISGVGNVVENRLIDQLQGTRNISSAPSAADAQALALGGLVAGNEDLLNSFSSNSSRLLNSILKRNPVEENIPVSEVLTDSKGLRFKQLRDRGQFAGRELLDTPAVGGGRIALDGSNPARFPEQAPTGSKVLREGRIIPQGSQAAFGLTGGIEIYRDENGDLKTRYNPVKGALGLALAGILQSSRGSVLGDPEISNRIGQTDSPDSIPRLESQVDSTVQTPTSPTKTLQNQEVESTPSQPSNSYTPIINSLKDKANQLYTKTIDRFNPISQLGKAAGKNQEIQNAMTGYYGATSTADYHIDFELAPILKEGNPKELRDLAIAQRDLELAGRNIKGSTNQSKAQDIIANLESKLGPDGLTKLNTQLDGLYKYQDNLVQKYLVDTGVMSPESFAAMKSQNQKYIPFQRVQDELDGILGFSPGNQAGSVSSNSVIKKIKGSEKEVIDPLESIVANTYKIVALGKRNQVARTIADLKDTLPEVIQPITGKIGNTPHISVFENGQKIDYAVPREVADAAKGMTEDQMGTIVRILAAPTKLFRATATGYNPEFMLPNTARDLQSAFVNVGLNPLGFVQGVASLMNKDEVYQDFLRSGGKVSSVSLDRPEVARKLFDITGEKGLTETRPSRILSILQTMGEYSEQPTRIAAFKQTRDRLVKEGLPLAEAEIQAANAAQESTVNFARRGSETRTVNALYAFLNARVQGTDRLLRSLKNDPKGVGLRMSMVTLAPALATYAWNRSFPSYNDDRVVPENDKRNNFIIMVSDKPVKKLGGAQYIKIPKGEIGKFANPIEEFLSFADGKGGEVGKSLTDVLKSFVPLDNAGDVAPTAVRPLLEDAANRNFFTGYEIVPEYKKSLPAENQDTSYTAPIFRALGDAINQSPARLQNLAEGYGTGFTKILEMATKPVLPGYTTPQNDRGADINQTPVLRRFLGGEKKSQKEALDSARSQQEYLSSQKTMLRNKIRRGEVKEDVGNKKLEDINKQLQDSSNKVKSLRPQSGNPFVQQASAAELKSTPPSGSSSVRPLTKDEKSNFKDAIKYGEPIDDSTLVNYYLGDIKGSKSDTGYKKTLRQRELFSVADKVEKDDNLSRDQKDLILKTIDDEGGINQSQRAYYDIAKQDNALKYEYIREQSQGMDRKTLFSTLMAGREVINGQKLTSDDVLDNLYEDGTLTKEEVKYLKALRWDAGKQQTYLDRDYKVGKSGKSSGTKTRELFGKTLSSLNTAPTKLPSSTSTALSNYQLDSSPRPLSNILSGFEGSRNLLRATQNRKF